MDEYIREDLEALQCHNIILLPPHQLVKQLRRVEPLLENIGDDFVLGDVPINGAEILLEAHWLHGPL